MGTETAAQEIVLEEGDNVRVVYRDGDAHITFIPFGCTEADFDAPAPQQSKEFAWRVLRGIAHDLAAADFMHGHGLTDEGSSAELHLLCEHGELLHKVPLRAVSKTLSMVYPGNQDDFMSSASLRAAVVQRQRQLARIQKARARVASMNAEKAMAVLVAAGNDEASKN